MSCEGGDVLRCIADEEDGVIIVRDLGVFFEELDLFWVEIFCDGPYGLFVSPVEVAESRLSESLGPRVHFVEERSWILCTMWYGNGTHDGTFFDEGGEDFEGAVFEDGRDIFDDEGIS